MVTKKNQESTHKLLVPFTCYPDWKENMHMDSNIPRTFALIMPLYMIVVLS